MLQLLIGTNIPFMKYRRYTYVFSSLVIASTIVWLVVHGGPRYSVDFTGGEMLQVRTSRVLSADAVRKSLDAGGVHGYELQQMSGANANEFIIRAQVHEGHDLFPVVQQSIQSHESGVTVEFRNTQRVGPKVGGELRSKAVWAVLMSLGSILLYVGFR